MDHAPTLSVVSSLQLPAASKQKPRFVPARLLIISLLLNGGLALGAGAAAYTLQAKLERLTQNTQSYAQATQSYASGLSKLGDEARALADGLVDVRAAVSNHAREESLFLKLLILKPTLNHLLARRIANAVQRECLLTGQDPNLVLSVIFVESDFNPRAVSQVGAVGLMQVMPLWKKVLEVDDLTQPETAIHAGVQILQHYQQLYDSDELTLTAYNRGPGQVNELIASGQNPTNGYSAKVLGLRQRLREIDSSAQP